MASITFEFLPLDYSLLYSDLINFHMKRNSYFPRFIYTNESVSDAPTEISFLGFFRAACRIAHALRPSRKDLDGKVVMVIADTDTLLHQAVVVGLSVAGWVPFLVSPRNSAAAIVSMMTKTNCTHIVTLDRAHKVLIDVIHHENGGAQLTIDELPALHYAFPKLGREIAADPFTPYPSPQKRPD